MSLLPVLGFKGLNDERYNELSIYTGIFMYNVQMYTITSYMDQIQCTNLAMLRYDRSHTAYYHKKLKYLQNEDSHTITTLLIRQLHN